MNAKILLFLFGIFSLGYSSGNAQSTATENVSTFELKAPSLDTIKRIWVYLPENYLKTKNAYPVLYLQDGQNLFDKATSYVGEWHIDESLDSLQLELIVVGIQHGGKKRINELTPFPHPTYHGGGAEPYLQFIVETLIPAINKKYRIKKGKKNTFIGGSSLGGLFSYYAILKYPDIFGKALLFSPSFWFSNKIFDYTKNIPNEQLSEMYFYFRAGDHEGEKMLPLMNKMKYLLLSKGVNSNKINYKSVVGGQHSESFWGSLFPTAALWLLNEKQ